MAYRKLIEFAIAALAPVGRRAASVAIFLFLFLVALPSTAKADGERQVVLIGTLCLSQSLLPPTISGWRVVHESCGLRAFDQQVTDLRKLRKSGGEQLVVFLQDLGTWTIHNRFSSDLPSPPAPPISIFYDLWASYFALMKDQKAEALTYTSIIEKKIDAAKAACDDNRCHLLVLIPDTSLIGRYFFVPWVAENKWRAGLETLLAPDLTVSLDDMQTRLANRNVNVREFHVHQTSVVVSNDQLVVINDHGAIKSLIETEMAKY